MRQLLALFLMALGCSAYREPPVLKGILSPDLMYSNKQEALVKPDEAKEALVKPDEAKEAMVKSDEAKLAVVKPHEVKPDETPIYEHRLEEVPQDPAEAVKCSKSTLESALAEAAQEEANADKLSESSLKPGLAEVAQDTANADKLSESTLKPGLAEVVRDTTKADELSGSTLNLGLAEVAQDTTTAEKLSEPALQPGLEIDSSATTTAPTVSQDTTKADKSSESILELALGIDTASTTTAPTVTDSGIIKEDKKHIKNSTSVLEKSKSLPGNRIGDVVCLCIDEDTANDPDAPHVFHHKATGDKYCSSGVGEHCMKECTKSSYTVPMKFNIDESGRGQGFDCSSGGVWRKEPSPTMMNRTVDIDCGTKSAIQQSISYCGTKSASCSSIDSGCQCQCCNLKKSYDKRMEVAMVYGIDEQYGDRKFPSFLDAVQKCYADCHTQCVYWDDDNRIAGCAVAVEEIVTRLGARQHKEEIAN